MSTTLENLTEAVQRYLGVQQAQTINPENATADALARLHGKRGNIARILDLWRSIPDVAPKLMADPDPGQIDDLRRLRDVLDVSFKVQSYYDGRARTFLPLSTRLINGKDAGTLYREIGRSVVDGLWADDALVTRMRAQTATWEQSHPLGRLLSPLATEIPLEVTKGEANLARVLNDDERLRAWRDRVVHQDWWAWLKAAETMSADEQLESMTSLIGLHLFAALVRRLAVEPDGSRMPHFFFAAVDGQAHNRVAARSATSFYSHWRDRADVALRVVARQAIESLADREPSFRSALSPRDWTGAQMWESIDFGKAKKQKEKYDARFREKLEQARTAGTLPTPEHVHQLIEDTLCEVFSAGTSVTSKIKDYLRTTGGSAGLVGPMDRGARKRFLLTERGLSLLARLHAHRAPDDVESNEEDPQSVEAFLDDLFDRYGLVVTLERERIRAAVFQTEESRRLARMLPNEDAIRRNRQQLELRLDALRLVRRYSDASTVIHVSQ